MHDDRYSDRSLFSDWVKLHQDADHLDHFGTYEIWMEFLYANHHNQTINEISNYLLNERLDELDKYYNELNYNISKAICSEKIFFMKNFTKRFAVETDGGVWDIDRILADYRK